MQIVLYDASWPKTGFILPTPPVKTAVVAPPAQKLFRSLGLNLIFVAILGIFFVSLPAIIPKISSQVKPKAEVEPIQLTFGQMAQQEQLAKEAREALDRKLASEEAQKYNVPTDFSIVIPKISAAARVIANVDPADEEAYRNALKLGVSHAQGTAFPGNKGTIYLFAHSTNTLANVSRYNAIFYQLKDLEAGDKVIIFYTGKEFIYQVTDKQIVGAKDVSWLSDSGEEKLVLQTCWPPGTSLKRLIIVAKPV